MKLVKIVFTTVKECEEVQTGVLPSGVWLYNHLLSGNIDNKAILMPYEAYIGFMSSLECYNHIMMTI